MEEVFLLLVVVRDESEAFVAHNALDCSTRHHLLSFRMWPISSDHSLLSCTKTPAVPFIFCAGKQWWSFPVGIRSLITPLDCPPGSSLPGFQEKLDDSAHYAEQQRQGPNQRRRDQKIGGDLPNLPQP
jgi:hypothetical protein